MSKSKIKSRISSLIRGELRGPENTNTFQSLRPSGISISIVRGRVEKEESDVIVNSVALSMNLNHGILSTAISATAGPGLQAAIDEYPGPLHYGDVLKTPGFKLRAKAVHHVVVPGFNYPDAGDTLEALVLHCLELADSDHHTSISFPALGTGRHSFPPFAVAHRMLEAIRSYEKRPGKETRVKSVRFVHTEQRCISAFISALGEIPNASQKKLVEKVKYAGSNKVSFLRPSQLKVNEPEEEAGVETSSDVHTRKTLPKKKLPNKLIKALGVNRHYKKEHLLSRLKQYYRELPQPASLIPWNYVITSRDQTHRCQDLDQLVDATVGPEVHRKRNLVIVHGMCYVGKSTFVRLIAQRWADGALRHVRLVVLVDMQTMLRYTTTSSAGHAPPIRDCLLRCFEAAGIDMAGGYELFNSSNGKLLLLIDDTEAWFCHFSAELSLDPLFAKAHVLVTSRSGCAYRLADSYHPKLTVELHGFGPELIGRYLELKRKESASAEQSSTAVQYLSTYIQGIRNMSRQLSPGWLTKGYEVLYSGAVSPAESKEVLKRLAQLLETYLTCFFDDDELDDFRRSQERFGEALLYYMMHKRDLPAAIMKRFDALLPGGPDAAVPRWLVDYCVAAFIVEQVRRVGQAPSLINTIEKAYLVQPSLEIACGKGHSVASCISRLIAALAADDPDVQSARDHALDNDDPQSARTLKQLNDLQVACLRQSGSSGQARPDVPEELQYLGAEYARAYLLACEQGTKAVHHTRVMLVGHYSAGKTSLRRRLVNGGFDPEYRITDGIDADPSFCRIQVDDTRNWKLIEEALNDIHMEEHNSEVARVLYNFIKKLKSSQLPVSEEPELPTPDIDQAKTIDFEAFSRSGSENAMDEVDYGYKLLSSPEPNVSSDGPPSLHASLENIRDESPLSSTGSYNRPERSNSMNQLVEAMGEAGLSDADKVMESLPDAILEKLKKLMLTDMQDGESSNGSSHSSDGDSGHRERGGGRDEGGGESEVRLSFWDFAGQHVFYTTHQTFLSHRAIYLLVLDLTQPLDNQIETYRWSRFGKVLDRACPQTVGEYLDYWLNSIHTHAVIRQDQEQEGPTQPPVIIVCTHRDVLESKYGKGEADRMVKAYFSSIQKRLHQKVYAEHVYPRFFAVSNLMDGDSMMDELKTTIVSVAKEQPYWGEEIPLKWLALRAKLRELQASSSKSVSTLQDIEELAREVGIGVHEDDSQCSTPAGGRSPIFPKTGSMSPGLDPRMSGSSEVITFLLFYHALGELVFFDEEPLRDFVVLEPQWLIDNFKKVITVSKFHKQHNFHNSRVHWTNLDDHGVLNDAILHNVWDGAIREQLATMMQKFNLILPISSDYQPHEEFLMPGPEEQFNKLYLVPCMLPQVSAEEIPVPVPHGPSPLLLVFREGFVPVGLFHRLLATCINQLNWECFGTVYHDYAVFLPDCEQPLSVSLQVKATCMELVARWLDEDSGEEGDTVSANGGHGTGCITGSSDIGSHSGTNARHYIPRPQCLQLLQTTLQTLTEHLRSLIRTVSPCQSFYIGTFCSCKTGKRGKPPAVVNVERSGQSIHNSKKIKCSTHQSVFDAQRVQVWFGKPKDLLVTPSRVPLPIQSPPPPSEGSPAPTPTELVPSDLELQDLASDIGHEWDRLGIRLGLSAAHIQQCQMDQPHSAEARIMSMLRRWRRMDREPRSCRRMEHLTNALLGVGRVDLAERVAKWRLAGKDLNLDWGRDQPERTSLVVGRDMVR